MARYTCLTIVHAKTKRSQDWFTVALLRNGSFRIEMPWISAIAIHLLHAFVKLAWVHPQNGPCSLPMYACQINSAVATWASAIDGGRPHDSNQQFVWKMITDEVRETYNQPQIYNSTRDPALIYPPQQWNDGNAAMCILHWCAATTRVLERFLAQLMLESHLRSPRCYHERKANSPYASAKVWRPDCLGWKKRREQMIKRSNTNPDNVIENDHNPQSFKNRLWHLNQYNMISQQQHGQFCGQEQNAKSNKTRKANKIRAQRTKIQAFSDVLLISSLWTGHRMWNGPAKRMSNSGIEKVDEAGANVNPEAGHPNLQVPTQDTSSYKHNASLKIPSMKQDETTSCDSSITFRIRSKLQTNMIPRFPRHCGKITTVGLASGCRWLYKVAGTCRRLICRILPPVNLLKCSRAHSEHLPNHQQRGPAP